MSADAIAMGYPCIGPDPDAAPNGLPAGYGAGKGRRRRIMKLKQFLSGIFALLFVVSLPVSALAAEWDISKGDITVNAGSGGQTVTQGGGAAVEDKAPVITGTSTENTVTINADKDQTANVTLSGADIDVSDKGKAAVTTTGDGNVSIELNGESTLKSGKGHAGLEKKNGGKLTIADEDKNGKLTAEGGKYGAGIGGGDQGAGSGITITGGEIKATGGQYGAGIGGGKGDGSDITISGGEVNATGGTSGAGIGGGYNGNGSDITITDGEVNATGGKYGAGIGGGEYGIGKDIIITGGEVNATGGRFSAGIGGGSRGTGSDITISGGEVNASGGVNGAGIGGGLRSKGKDITVSGDTKLKVQAGDEDHYDGAGAGIGDGGSNAYGTKILGAEVEPDTSGLTTNGSIAYYAPGADMEKDKPTSTTVGTLPPQEKPVAERSAAAPRYRVTDKDGRNMAYTAEQAGGVLTVTVDADFAILTGSLSNIRTLKAQGVEKIVFVTKGAASAFALADLLENGSTGKTYKLTHDGKTVTFTLGEDMADVSAILTQP